MSSNVDEGIEVVTLSDSEEEAGNGKGAGGVRISVEEPDAMMEDGGSATSSPLLPSESDDDDDDDEDE
jgi:hypothetical protein